MQSYRKEIQSKLLKYGSFKEIIKKYGVITMVDFAISNFLDLMSKRFYKFNSADYRLSEAFFRSRDIDRWSRYAHVANEIQKIKGKELSVLDVGSGGQGIFGFLSPLRRDCDFFLLDVRKDALKGLRRAHPVIGDGCRLPFTDKAFDIIVSIDTTEHIPKFIRHSFYEELKRAHKKKIIITCPMQSNDGLFQGKKYDIVFQYFYKKEKGIEEPNTAQHIASDHPTVNEIKEEFPGVQSMDIKTVIFGLNICCFHLNRS